MSFLIHTFLFQEWCCEELYILPSDSQSWCLQNIYKVRMTKMIEGIHNFNYERRLKLLKLHSLERRRVRDLIEVGI